MNLNKEEKIQLGQYKVFDDAIHKMQSRFSFSIEDFELIKKSYERKSSMDYRWYIECIDDTVYILRSWNPFIVFKIPFEKIGDKYISSIAYSCFETQKESNEATIQAQNYRNFWVYSLITQLIFNEGSIMWMDAMILGNRVSIDLNGIHGFIHWRDVYNMGRRLSNEIDKKVLFYFSIFHDFFRESDYRDPKHGKKALYALDSVKIDLKQWNKDSEDINKQLEQLAFALEYHDATPEEWSNIKNHLKDDKTVQICLDSDKLDLGRAGIQPEEKYLLTSEAKLYLKENL